MPFNAEAISILRYAQGDHLYMQETSSDPRTNLRCICEKSQVQRLRVLQAGLQDILEVTSLGPEARSVGEGRTSHRMLGTEWAYLWILAVVTQLLTKLPEL